MNLQINTWSIYKSLNVIKPPTTSRAATFVTPFPRMLQGRSVPWLVRQVACTGVRPGHAHPHGHARSRVLSEWDSASSRLIRSFPSSLLQRPVVFLLFAWRLLLGGKFPRRTSFYFSCYVDVKLENTGKRCHLRRTDARYRSNWKPWRDTLAITTQ